MTSTRGTSFLSHSHKSWSWGGASNSLIHAMETGQPTSTGAPKVFVFNPFAEGYIAHGKAFTPVKHQAKLAEDLTNIPQFLCEPGDVVLVTKQPSSGFLAGLQQAGFSSPRFVELTSSGRVPDSFVADRGKPGGLRPWAWGPDSAELLEPLLERTTEGHAAGARYFNSGIARLYSKAWSAQFLKKVLDRCRGLQAASVLCTGQEAGTAVSTLDDALTTIASIRARGHHKIVVKEALGLAGHNAIRLWEPELLPAQLEWLSGTLIEGRQVVVEPWLEREQDFSIQFEMGPGGLVLRGFTGLINDLKGQFIANWAEPAYSQRVPSKVQEVFRSPPVAPGVIEELYAEIASVLEPDLKQAGFIGPVSIDAFVYRTPNGHRRLKPVVEINPRYTMGRLTLELMQHAAAGKSGLFRLVSMVQARNEGFPNLSGYAEALRGRQPLCLENADASPLKILAGTLCLNDPEQAQVCLATFEVASQESQFSFK